MGMYDTIRIPCPKCGEPVEVQSKGGDCLLNNYTLDTAPEDVLLGLQKRGYDDECDKCGVTLRPVVEIQRPIVWLEIVAPKAKGRKESNDELEIFLRVLRDRDAYVGRLGLANL